MTASLSDIQEPADGELLECFVQYGDPESFEILVRRHGPMVLGVCRRMLGNGHDAEDAFQAAFLVLVRKAATVVPRDVVANWLYGVACRTALRARAARDRRTRRERSTCELPDVGAVARDPDGELREIVDRELSRLPEKYRVPVILCELEGLSYRDAALQMGLTEGAISMRLARAKKLLESRLVRQGLIASTGALAFALSSGTALANVSDSLIASTVHAAPLWATGSAASVVPLHVANLARGVQKTMLLAKLKIGVLLVAVTVSVIGVGGAIYFARAEDKAVPKQPESLEGTWIAISVEVKGRRISEKEVQQAEIRWIVKGENVTITTREHPDGLKATVKIDASVQPPRLDLTLNRKKTAAPGIFEQQGDTLKLCYGKERPTEFRTKSEREADQRLYVFKRDQE